MGGILALFDLRYSIMVLIKRLQISIKSRSLFIRYFYLLTVKVDCPATRSTVYFLVPASTIQNLGGVRLWNRVPFLGYFGPFFLTIKGYTVIADIESICLRAE